MTKKLLLKVCGLRDSENITRVLALDPDFIGFIFYPPSKRFAGETVLNNLPVNSDSSQAGRVGVFVNAEIDEVLFRVRSWSLNAVQLHGTEDPRYCEDLKAVLPDVKIIIIKSFGVEPGFDFGLCRAYEDFCDFFLFDTKCSTHGGSGRTFDWNLLEAYKGKIPAFLSGGIGPENIASAREVLIKHPEIIGVDINSGVELRPGFKSVEAISKVISEINR